MRCMDHHGVTAVAGGSIIAKLMRTNGLVPGANQKERLAEINRQMKEYQDTHVIASKMPPLREKDLITDKWDEMSGPLIKAANMRSLAPFLELLAITYFCEPGNAFHESIVGFITALNQFYYVIYAGDVFLTAREKRLLRISTLEMGMMHMKCRQHAEAAGEMSFQVKPKAHYTQHIPYQSQLFNPRFVQCYQEESMVGLIKMIYMKSKSGPYAKRIQRVVLIKYILYFALASHLKTIRTKNKLETSTKMSAKTPAIKHKIYARGPAMLGHAQFV